MYDSPSTIVALSYVQSVGLLFGELTVNISRLHALPLVESQVV